MDSNDDSYRLVLSRHGQKQSVQPVVDMLAKLNQDSIEFVGAAIATTVYEKRGWLDFLLTCAFSVILILHLLVFSLSLSLSFFCYLGQHAIFLDECKIAEMVPEFLEEKKYQKLCFPQFFLSQLQNYQLQRKQGTPWGVQWEYTTPLPEANADEHEGEEGQPDPRRRSAVFTHYAHLYCAIEHQLKQLDLFSGDNYQRIGEDICKCSHLHIKCIICYH